MLTRISQEASRLWRHQGAWRRVAILSAILVPLLCICTFAGALGCQGPTPTPTAIAVARSSTPEPTARATARATETTLPIAGPPATSSATAEPSAAPACRLEVHFVDVGQGDAILIVGPDGKAALIDGGEAGAGALQYLQAQGVKRLELMVATHPDSDHIGGLPEVLAALPVGQVATNGQPHTTTAYERFLDAIAAARAPYREVRRGDTLQVGGLALQVLHPAGVAGEDLNDNSLVLRLEYAGMSYLFTGDVQAAGEASMLAAGQPVDVAVLKVAHHASHSSSSPAFLEAVSPILAVYSCGRNNTHGHPSAETLANLAAAGAEVHGTDQEGTIVVTWDGARLDLASSPVATRAPPTGTARPAEPTQPPAGLTLEILSLTSPIARGANATLTARTAPGAACTIAVYYKSGPSEVAGLGPKTADTGGNVSWTWKVGTGTTPGTSRIVVIANAGGNQVTREIPFEVTG